MYRKTIAYLKTDRDTQTDRQTDRQNRQAQNGMYDTQVRQPYSYLVPCSPSGTKVTDVSLLKARQARDNFEFYFYLNQILICPS